MFDVVVVGAGPAGSTAAYHLADHGSLDVLVVDRSAFPRHKSCGGALNRCRDWAGELPIYAEVQALLPAHANQHVRICTNRDLWWEGRDSHLFDQVSRMEFDNRLLQAATARPGVSFRVFRLRSLEAQRGGSFLLSDGVETLRARAVVGADGVGSVTSRSLGNPPRGETQAGACIEQEIVCAKSHEIAHIFFLWSGEPGYCWIFPTREGYNVGAGFLGPARKRVKQLFAEFTTHCVQQGLLPLEGDRQTFGALAPATVVQRVAGDRVLLVGDAAGLLSQLSGEGIYYAMKSGQAAGRALCEDLDGAAQRYQSRIQPLIDEVTYTRTLRPGLLTGAMGCYFGISRAAGIVGLDRYAKGPLVNRFFRRQSLESGSQYERLR